MLLRFPSSWPHSAVAVTAMLLLAGLDLAGAFAAKEAVTRRSWPLAAAGVVIFLLLFWVYASSLQYVDLGPVTLGWVVLLQIGVLLLDRFRYGAALPRGAWVAVALLVGAQGYLLLAPAGPAPGAQLADEPVGDHRVVPSGGPSEMTRPWVTER